MKVSSQKNNITFKSTPIHYLNLKKVTNGFEDGFVKAIFSKLDSSNTEDIKAVAQIKKNWKEKSDSDLLDIFCFGFSPEFQKNCHHYVIELIGNKPLAERIIGIAKAVNTKKFFPQESNNLYLSLIKVKPELEARKKDRTIKNLGELLLGEMFYKAKISDSSSLTFDSVNNNFFLRTFKSACINLTNSGDFPNYKKNSFNLDKKKFDAYINYCEKKFGIDFSEKIKDGITI